MTIAQWNAALASAGVQDSDTVFYISIKEPTAPAQVTRRLLSDGTTWVVEAVN
jgi:hypothetical protein